MTVYAAASLTGNVAPLRTISGPATGLNAPADVFVSGGNVYLSNAGGNSITIFPTAAIGNAAPATTISGTNTLLSVPQELFVDSTGKIYVANFNTPGFPGFILVFAAGATGNAAPTQTIGGSNTGLVGTVGLTL